MLNIIFQDTVNHIQFFDSGAADLEDSLSGLGGEDGGGFPLHRAVIPQDQSCNLFTHGIKRKRKR